MSDLLEPIRNLERAGALIAAEIDRLISVEVEDQRALRQHNFGGVQTRSRRMSPTRSQIEEATEDIDEIYSYIEGDYFDEKWDLGKKAERVKRILGAVLSAPTDMMCLTHRSLWYDNEGQCQRAAAATAWKEDDTMWQDCTAPAPVALVPMEDGE